MNRPADPAKPVEISERTIRIVRYTLIAIVAGVLLLVFAVPQRPPPPPSLAQPEQAFVDRVGIVSPGFARQWAGALLNDDRAQIVIYVDRKPPEGELSAWAIQTASDWKVGAAKDDTGVVVFVFTEPRLARIDVGYGLEDRLTDARVRRLLEDNVAPAFARGEYERGFDSLIYAVRKVLGGDDADSIHARAAEARKRADVPWPTQVATAFERMPRMTSATVRNFLEGGAGARITILVFVTVGLGIVLMGLGCAVNTVWRVATIPAKLRERKGRAIGSPEAAVRLAGDLKVFEIVMGIGGFAICFAMIVFVLLAAEGFLTRRGNFGGAGAAIVWPAPPAR